MAELTITAANVKATATTSVSLVQFGEAVDQGEVVYLKTSDSKYWLANNGAEATSDVAGVALTPNIADGYGIIAKSGQVDLGATLSVGQTYALASTSGKIELESDVGSGEYVTLLGVAATAALIDLDIVVSGTAHA
jgi:hypothetical protein